MNFFRSKQDDPLDQAISELRAEQPDAKTLSASAEHVWQKLQAGLGEDAATSALQPIRGCADIRALLPAFHQQELPEARALIVEHHLKECVSCRSYAHGRAVDASQMLAGAWNQPRAVSSGAFPHCLSRPLHWPCSLHWFGTGRTWYIDGPPGSRARIDSIAGVAYRVGPTGEHRL